VDRFLSVTVSIIVVIVSKNWFGVTVAVPCEPGTYSGREDINKVLSRSYCRPCPAGKVQARFSQKQCERCPSGTVPNEEKTLCVSECETDLTICSACSLHHDNRMIVHLMLRVCDCSSLVMSFEFIYNIGISASFKCFQVDRFCRCFWDWNTDVGR